MSRLEESIRVERILREAGWYPGRSVKSAVERWSRILDRPGEFLIFPAAREALEEYGGLSVKVPGPGVDFGPTPFDLDPTLCSGEDDRFAEHSKQLGLSLYPLGEAEGGQSFLAIATDGSVYLITADDLLLMGRSAREALHCMILGRNCQGTS